MSAGHPPAGLPAAPKILRPHVMRILPAIMPTLRDKTMRIEKAQAKDNYADVKFKKKIERRSRKKR